MTVSAIALGLGVGLGLKKGSGQQLGVQKLPTSQVNARMRRNLSPYWGSDTITSASAFSYMKLEGFILTFDSVSFDYPPNSDGTPPSPPYYDIYKADPHNGIPGISFDFIKTDSSIQIPISAKSGKKMSVLFHLFISLSTPLTISSFL